MPLTNIMYKNIVLIKHTKYWALNLSPMCLDFSTDFDLGNTGQRRVFCASERGRGLTCDLLTEIKPVLISRFKRTKKIASGHGRTEQMASTWAKKIDKVFDSCFGDRKTTITICSWFLYKKKLNYDLQKNNLTEKVCQLHNYIPYIGASYNTFFHGLFKYFFWMHAKISSPFITMIC